MEYKFAFAMVMAFVTLLLCSSKKTTPIAVVTGAISVLVCFSMVPDLLAGG